MMRYPDARVLVFAKAPRPGGAKTRMIPRLSPAGAAGLHAALVRHTLAMATATAVSPVELWCAPDHGDAFFERCAADFPVSLHTQHGADLGERMRRALDDALTRCHTAVLIGTDCPALTAAHLKEAVQTLQSGDEAVLVPAEDGGYVLIGLRRTDPGLFEDISWGTPEVMTATRKRLDRAGWRWRATDPLADVDTPGDLDRLAENAERLPQDSPLRSWMEKQGMLG